MNKLDAPVFVVHDDASTRDSVDGLLQAEGPLVKLGLKREDAQF